MDIVGRDPDEELARKYGVWDHEPVNAVPDHLDDDGELVEDALSGVKKGGGYSGSKEESSKKQTPKEIVQSYFASVGRYVDTLDGPERDEKINEISEWIGSLKGGLMIEDHNILYRESERKYSFIYKPASIVVSWNVPKNDEAVEDERVNLIKKVKEIAKAIRKVSKSSPDFIENSLLNLKSN